MLETVRHNREIEEELKRESIMAEDQEEIGQNESHSQ